MKTFGTDLKRDIPYDEFISMLNNQANGRKYKSKIWVNYPQSVFYYWEDDNEMQNEIAIYTNERAWGIMI